LTVYQKTNFIKHIIIINHLTKIYEIKLNFCSLTCSKVRIISYKTETKVFPPAGNFSRRQTPHEVRCRKNFQISNFKKILPLRKRINVDGKEQSWTDTMTLISAFHKLSYNFNNGLKIYRGLRKYSILIGSSEVRSQQLYMQSIGRQNCFAFWKPLNNI